MVWMKPPTGQVSTGEEIVLDGSVTPLQDRLTGSNENIDHATMMTSNMVG